MIQKLGSETAVMISFYAVPFLLFFLAMAFKEDNFSNKALKLLFIGSGLFFLTSAFQTTHYVMDLSNMTPVDNSTWGIEKIGSRVDKTYAGLTYIDYAFVIYIGFIVLMIAFGMLYDSGKDMNQLFGGKYFGRRR